MRYFSVGPWVGYVPCNIQCCTLGLVSKVLLITHFLGNAEFVICINSTAMFTHQQGI